jgi:hypothetical protein
MLSRLLVAAQARESVPDSVIVMVVSRAAQLPYQRAKAARESVRGRARCWQAGLARAATLLAAAEAHHSPAWAGYYPPWAAGVVRAAEELQALTLTWLAGTPARRFAVLGDLRPVFVLPPWRAVALYKCPLVVLPAVRARAFVQCIH